MDKEKNANNNPQSLKAKREALGFSLKDMFQRTRVSVIYLEAIENGNFHLLPVPTYTKNFIKIYAHALGMDSKPILRSYEDYLISLKVSETMSPEDASEKVPISTRIASYKTYMGGAFVLIVIVFVGWLISMQYQPASDVVNKLTEKITAVNSSVNTSSPINEQTKANIQTTLTETNQQTQVSQQSTSSVQVNATTKPLAEQSAAPPTENAQPIANSEETNLLIIKVIEETWIRIKADQKPSFQVLLKPGEKIEFKAAIIDMDIGNAGGIKMQFKGRNIENLGKSGQVIHLRLP